LKKKTVVALGCCSSISIYKSCEIIRMFQRLGFDVQSMMTKNASKLISPLLISALTGHSVFIDPYEEEYSERIDHVAVSQEVSLFLVAPATANIIGKFASGIADDFISTFYLAVECPVILAPAMNENMYLHKQTQKNIRQLQAQGVKFVLPEKGYLACKDEGWGRLADPEEIVEVCRRTLDKSRTLQGKTVMVTAGPTREFLDPVRYLSNRSSGKMGYEIADAAKKRGADVILISGPTQLFPPKNVKMEKIQSAVEMDTKVKKHFQKADVVIMVAAVADFMFSDVFSHKLKKNRTSEIPQLSRTPDILGGLTKKKGDKVLVGFAAETDSIEKNALKKMHEKKLDMMIVNDVSKADIGFESEFNQVTILLPGKEKQETGTRSKHEISQMILDNIEEILENKS